MGISASIAGSSRKYRTNGDLPHHQKSTKHSAIEVGDENEDDLASVSSFRPSSPLAHQDARAFTLDGPHTKQRNPRNQVNRHSYYSIEEPSYRGNSPSYHGSLDRSSRAGNGSHSSYIVRDPSSRALVSQSASSVYASRPGPARTMRDVREYLLHNPELLAGKKNQRMRQSVESDLYGLSTNHKQMKTKQSVYMGLINPPVVYGVGARPDHRQLRVDQKLYLNLVYPTIRPKEYHQQAIRSRPPLKQEGMVVVRKNDYLQQPNGYIKRPLPQMQVSRVHDPSRVKSVPRPESVQHERTIPRHNASTSQGSRGQSQYSTKTNPKRASNDYVDFPHIDQEPLTSRSVKSERQALRDRQMNGFVQSGNSRQTIARQFSGREEDDVVFTFNVDDLDLRKKNGVAHYEHDKDSRQVVPLYFRKSLAYSPKYENSQDLLSSPL
ncbi:uncharacterized protein LOC144643490 [Oculina patagonica]